MASDSGAMCRDVESIPRYYESVLSTRSLSYVSYASTNTMYGDEQMGMDMDDDTDAPLPPSFDPSSRSLPASVAHSMLFELPRELRDRIYSYTLAGPDDKDVQWPCKPRSLQLQPALLRTCKIIYSEAAALLYTLNSFAWTHPSDANVFVRAFASPIHGRQIARVRLDLKMSDMRLWMPYLTSTDDVRSLRADFPNLRELDVRYQSMKWHHLRAPEDNLKAWIDDSKLEEMMRGLRSVFPSPIQDDVHDYDMGIGDQEFRDYLQRNPVNFDDPNETREFRTRLHAAHKARHAEKVRLARENAASLRKRYVSIPTIRVTCVCRVPEAHFSYLTNPPAAAKAQPVPTDGTEPATEPMLPVVEGEAFRGFSVLDFGNHMIREANADVGAAGVAWTPYADRHGLLLALEVHHDGPKVVQID